MNCSVRRLCGTLIVAVLPLVGGYAQKVKVGYDKTADFTQYKTYTWAEPEIQPTRPMLYAAVANMITNNLSEKGLTRVQADGDLILVPAGGVDFGFNRAAGTPILPTYGGPPPVLNATMWTGATSLSGSLSTYVPEGTLLLDFVDRGQNKLVWSGTVAVKLDMEHKRQSVELVQKAITKLLKEFPPGKK